MPLQLADVEDEYAKDRNLNPEEVQKVVEWVSRQPHLPKINEIQALLFLHACYYDVEAAKRTVDAFFTLKTVNTFLFKDKNPLTSPVKESLNVTIFAPLPKKTPEGYTVIFLKVLDSAPGNFHCVTQFKIFDMVGMMHLHQDGISEGHVTVFDMKGTVFGHLFRVSPSLFKKLLDYVQEGLPGRVKRIHFVNIVPFMDMVLGAIKPFMKKELYDIIYLHKTVDDLVKMVPRECLPQEYGGAAESVAVLHEKIKRRLNENVDFFKWEDEQFVDESKRPGKKSSWFS